MPAAWYRARRRIPPALSVFTSTIGNGGKAVLDYFAPSIAVVFLFIGSGLGMRSLLLERSNGTLARLAAAPDPAQRPLCGESSSPLP